MSEKWRKVELELDRKSLPQSVLSALGRMPEDAFEFLYESIKTGKFNSRQIANGLLYLSSISSRWSPQRLGNFLDLVGDCVRHEDIGVRSQALNILIAKYLLYRTPASGKSVTNEFERVTQVQWEHVKPTIETALELGIVNKKNEELAKRLLLVDGMDITT